MSEMSTPEQVSADSAIYFLVQAARPSRVLREQVQIVDDEIKALRAALIEMYRFVQVELESEPYAHTMASYVVAGSPAHRVATALQEAADEGHHH